VRISIYIDGFNLYYAIRESGCKWLNVKALVEAALPPNASASLINKIKYYTARVSGANDPDQPRRQHIYLNALHTVSEVEIFFG
jgi:hypothetical protein